MLPKEQRAALLASKEYMSLWRRGVLDKVVAAQRDLQNFMAYGYDPGYLHSAYTEIIQALNVIKGENNANAEV